MLKMVIKTATVNDPRQGSAAVFASMNSEQKSQHLLVSHSYAHPGFTEIFGCIDNRTKVPASDLVKLLLMHPYFRNNHGLLDFIYADMLELIGLNALSVINIADSFKNSDLMIVMITEDFTDPAIIYENVSINGHFSLKLHNNCRSLIKKAMVNLIHLPSIKWERQVAP